IVGNFFCCANRIFLGNFLRLTTAACYKSSNRQHQSTLYKMIKIYHFHSRISLYKKLMDFLILKLNHKISACLINPVLSGQLTDLALPVPLKTPFYYVIFQKRLNYF
ncbi:MAG: hypothetical protein DWB48_11580, partial [Nitrosomonas sp.]|nr:hypothetical protein [Nitrosomonas sp.]